MKETGGTREIVNEGIGAREARSCPLCASEGRLRYEKLRDPLFGVPGMWASMDCPKCHFVWLHPRPVPSAIGSLYKNYFTHDPVTRAPVTCGLRQKVRDTILAAHMNYGEIAISPLGRKMGKILSWVGPLKERVEMGVMNLPGQKKGVLLDIGCGSGEYLSRMGKLGWEVLGIEPDGQAAEAARKGHGLDVIQGTTEGIDLPDHHVDAITMNHVIEHVHDPLKTLGECSRLLKAGGRFVVVTPNAESLGNRIFKKSCLNLDPPRHLYLFSPDSLRACVERAGLRVIALRTLPRTASHVLISSSLIRRDGNLPGGFPKSPRFGLRLKGRMFQAIERGLCQFSNLGEEILLIATSPEPVRRQESLQGVYP